MNGFGAAGPLSSGGRAGSSPAVLAVGTDCVKLSALLKVVKYLLAKLLWWCLEQAAHKLPWQPLLQRQLVSLAQQQSSNKQARDSLEVEEQQLVEETANVAIPAMESLPMAENSNSTCGAAGSDAHSEKEAAWTLLAIPALLLLVLLFSI